MASSVALREPASPKAAAAARAGSPRTAARVGGRGGGRAGEWTHIPGPPCGRGRPRAGGADLPRRFAVGGRGAVLDGGPGAMLVGGRRVESAPAPAPNFSQAPRVGGGARHNEVL